MQNDRFQFQTVANTRQVVPGKKSPQKNQTLSKKTPKTILHPWESIQPRFFNSPFSCFSIVSSILSHCFSWFCSIYSSWFVIFFPCFFPHFSISGWWCECFTDDTLAHPLNCRGGVVARLSA